MFLMSACVTTLSISVVDVALDYVSIMQFLYFSTLFLHYQKIVCLIETLLYNAFLNLMTYVSSVRVLHR